MPPTSVEAKDLFSRPPDVGARYVQVRDEVHHTCHGQGRRRVHFHQTSVCLGAENTAHVQLTCTEHTVHLYRNTSFTCAETHGSPVRNTQLTCAEHTVHLYRTHGFTCTEHHSLPCTEHTVYLSRTHSSPVQNTQLTCTDHSAHLYRTHS